MPVHHQITKNLQHEARKRAKMMKARGDVLARKTELGGYHKLQQQLNEATFLDPIDAETTRASIYYTRKKFMRYCQETKQEPWDRAISVHHCGKGLIMAFLRWICETYLLTRRKRSKRKSVNQYWRDFKMLYRRMNQGSAVNANDAEEIRKYINGDLTKRFNLDTTAKWKPVMGVDDLLLGLTHHWAQDTSIFPTEGDRLDLPTIMLFQAYTACRPAELVDGTKKRGAKNPLLDDPNDGHAVANLLDTASFSSDSSSASDLEETTFDRDGGYHSDARNHTANRSGSDFAASDIPDQPSVMDHVVTKVFDDGEATRKHKTLCYEDLVLWIVKDPKKKGRDLLALEVCFRYHKGFNNKPKPTIFLFREHPLPILCPITHILARAIRDDAIEVDGFNQAKAFFSTDINETAVKIHWKPSMLKTPVFRRSVRYAAGWIKSETEPMRYQTYAFYLDRIGLGVGSEDKWTSYCMRRGNCNAILGVAPDGVVDQVMRHDPMTGCVQNSYQNERVGFNTQDAFLERDPSADGLTKAFTHMSIRCNPAVPREIPQAELNKLQPDADVTKLREDVKQLSRQIKYQYRFINAAPQRIRRSYSRLRLDLKNAEQAFKRDMTQKYREACRQRIYNQELERQFSGRAVEKADEPAVRHQLAERTQLSSLMCDFKTDMSDLDMINRKVRAIDLLVRLAALREVDQKESVEAQVNGDVTGPADDASHSQAATEIPLRLGKTQCIFCIGDESLPYAHRLYAFARVSNMMTHVEEVHMRHEVNVLRFVCRHPHCQKLVLSSLDQFRDHVQTTHGVRLRSRA